MLNQDIYVKDPLANQLANNGVAEVKDDNSEQALATLKYELETFVCDGEYEKGLDKILSTFLSHLQNDQEQPAGWISGFYGSGKSHLAKMLRAFWSDFEFGDGTTARGISVIPQETQDYLKELSAQARRHGGLHAASGTLGQGGHSSIRLELLSIIFVSADLPEKYHLAQFVMWLRKEGIEDAVKNDVGEAGRVWESEVTNLFMSKVLSQAVLNQMPTLAKDEAELRQTFRSQYKRVEEISDADMVTAIKEALSSDGRMPLTLIVLDEMQQYIISGNASAFDVQNVVQACSKSFSSQLLFVATGQNALSGMTELNKLMGRFQVSIQLSDTDVESVIRKIILRKKSSALPLVEKLLSDNLGEISRHLRGSKIEYVKTDEDVMAADYPMLPIRRRFWEKVLRIVDTTGTVSQLRNQLKVVHEATKFTANMTVGHVVTGDFIYQQIAQTLLMTGVISKDLHEKVSRLANGDDDEKLRSKLLALVFLIGKLPTEAISNIGVKSTEDVLADLLVEDLSNGSTELRKRVPLQLEYLAKDGSIMVMVDSGGENVYLLQTQESSAWHDTYRQQEADVAGNPQRIDTERDDLLAKRARQASNDIRLQQGKSNEARKLSLCFDAELPRDANKQLYAWVQHGWQADEKSVISDARADDNKNGTLYVFIPARNRSDLNQAITTEKAAAATMDIRGIPSGTEGKDARASMETRKQDADKSKNRLLDEIFDGVRVFISGGSEVEGNGLKEKLEKGAKDSLQRLYKQFDVADEANWGKVVDKARKAGGETALSAINYQGENAQHPVCAQILKYIGSGKKGSDIRDNFQDAPFGWPQDAIDGAIYALMASGDLKAKNANNQPVDSKALERKHLTQARFEVENITLSTVQKLAVRKLLTETIGCKPGEEDSKTTEFLQFARGLASKAGGQAPQPHHPDTARINEIAGEAGNSRLVKLHDYKDDILSDIKHWQTQQLGIEKRMPNWGNLKTLTVLSRGLTFYEELSAEVLAIETGRRLLDNPDPVENLVNDTTDNLRGAIQYHFDQYKTAYDQALIAIETDANWVKLEPEKQNELLSRRSIKAPEQLKLNSTADVIDALEACSLEQWNDRREALQNKFENAREEAAQLLMPKTVRAQLPRATLESAEDIDAWLVKAREELEAKLLQGPVLV